MDMRDDRDTTTCLPREEPRLAPVPHHQHLPREHLYLPTAPISSPLDGLMPAEETLVGIGAQLRHCGDEFDAKYVWLNKAAKLARHVSVCCLLAVVITCSDDATTRMLLSLRTQP